MSFLIAPAVSALATAGASKLFGGGSSKASAGLSTAKPTNINAGGLSTSLGRDNVLSVTPSAERLGLVSGVANTFGPQADFLGSLLSKVAPGFSDLRTSRLAEIENARQSAIGNLRDNLARRRVLGSSFAGDAINRGNLEFAQEKEKAQAESLLQEIDMSNQIAQAQFEAQRSQFQTFLDEMNLHADLATQLSSQATSQLGANARLKAQLDAMSAQGAGKFFGQTLQPAVNQAGTNVSSWFSQPTSSSAADPWAGLR